MTEKMFTGTLNKNKNKGWLQKILMLSNKNIKMSSLKSSENIQKNEGGPFYFRMGFFCINNTTHCFWVGIDWPQSRNEVCPVLPSQTLIEIFSPLKL